MFSQYTRNIWIVTLNALFSFHTTLNSFTTHTFRSYWTGRSSYTLITFCTNRSMIASSALKTLFTFRSFWTNRSSCTLCTFCTMQANITFFPYLILLHQHHLSSLTPAPQDGLITPLTPFGPCGPMGPASPVVPRLP